MKIIIESTPIIVELGEPGEGRARRWEGTTESGIQVVALVAAIKPQSNDPAVNAQFAAELKEIASELEAEEPEEVDLGPCCICETTVGVCNVIMLDLRGEVPGHGWGCFVCDLPAEGASAVLCDRCLDAYQRDPSVLTMACRGYPATDGRVAIAGLAPFEHDQQRHREDAETMPDPLIDHLVDQPIDSLAAETTGGWKATLFSGDRRPVFGAIRTTQRLHWTQKAARDEALRWLVEMCLEPITAWEAVDERWTIGRNRTHYVIVRRILFPLGPAPPEALA